MLAMGFLDVIDNILGFIFGVGIPLCVGILGVIFAVGFFALLPKAPGGSMCMATMLICVILFFSCFADVGGEDESYWDYAYSAVVAAIIMGVAMGAAWCLNKFGIPWIFVFVLYLGIAIWGA